MQKATEPAPLLSLEQAVIVGQELTAKKNNQSKHYIYSYFDNAVRGDTIVYPGEADAVVTTPIKGAKQGLAVTMDSNLYGDIDPYTSGAYAVAESVRNVIAVGARPLALTDCLNYGNPEKPDVFFDFKEGVRGIKDAANALSFIDNEPVPIISGNVSLYNESKNGNAVIPSPVVMCVARVENYHHTLTMQLRDTDSVLVMVGKRYAEFGSTQLSSLMDVPNNKVAPQVRLEDEKNQNKVVLNAIQNRWLTACHDISSGGAWQALVEMMLGEHAKPKAGISLEIPKDTLLSEFFFSENGGYILSVPMKNLHLLQAELDQANCNWQRIGKTTNVHNFAIQYQCESTQLSANQLAQKWQQIQR